MTPNNIRMIVKRETDGGTILPIDQPAGTLYHELRVDCPECSTSNLLARWVDHGGVAVGSLTCDKCGAVLLEADETAKPEPPAEQPPILKPLDDAHVAAIKNIFNGAPADSGSTAVAPASPGEPVVLQDKASSSMAPKPDEP